MSSRRQKVALIVASTVALVFLFGILVWQRRRSPERWNTFLVGDPRLGHKSSRKRGAAAAIPCSALGERSWHPIWVCRGRQDPT